MIHILVNYICWTNEINWTSNDHTICLVDIESPGFASKKKCFVSKEQTIKININKNPLSKERNSNCKDFSLTMVANKNLLSKENDSKCKDLSLAYYKLFIAKKCNSIVSMSIVFCVETWKYIGKNSFFFPKQYVGMLFLRDIENMVDSFLIKEHLCCYLEYIAFSRFFGRQISIFVCKYLCF